MHRQALKPVEVSTKSPRNPKKSPDDLTSQATTQSEPTPTSKGKKTKVVTPKAPAVIETTPRKTRAKAKAERETAAPLGSSTMSTAIQAETVVAPKKTKVVTPKATKAKAGTGAEITAPLGSSTMSTAIQAETVVAPKKTKKPQSKPKPVVSPPPGFIIIPDPAYGQTQEWWDECDKRGFKYGSNFTPEASQSFLKRSAIAIKWDESSTSEVSHVDMEIMLPTTLTANADTNFSHLAFGNANKFYDDSNSIKISVAIKCRSIHKAIAKELDVTISHIPTDIQNEMEKIFEGFSGDSFYLNQFFQHMCCYPKINITEGNAEEFAALVTVLRYRPTASGEFNHYINIDLDSILLVSLPHMFEEFSSKVEKACEDMKPHYLGESDDSDDSDENTT